MEHDTFERLLLGIDSRPIYLCLLSKLFFEPFVCQVEMVTTQEAFIGRQGRRVDGFEDLIFLLIETGDCLLSVCTPRHKDNRTFAWSGKYDFHYSTRKLVPTNLGV